MGTVRLGVQLPGGRRLPRSPRLVGDKMDGAQIAAPRQSIRDEQ